VKTDVRLLREKCPDVLVGTPGRLNDLLENHGLAQLVRGLTSLVFDEADQLLEMGFRPAIGKYI
jgi:ATP-dependent RNA helicase MSS116, mitochondrial